MVVQSVHLSVYIERIVNHLVRLASRGVLIVRTILWSTIDTSFQHCQNAAVARSLLNPFQKNDLQHLQSVFHKPKEMDICLVLKHMLFNYSDSVSCGTTLTVSTSYFPGPGPGPAELPAA